MLNGDYQRLMMPVPAARRNQQWNGTVIAFEIPITVDDDIIDIFTIFRFIAVLDQLDTRVEKIRKEALNLQEKRDYLLMSIDLIKNNELLASLDECNN